MLVYIRTCVCSVYCHLHNAKKFIKTNFFCSAVLILTRSHNSELIEVIHISFDCK